MMIMVITIILMMTVDLYSIMWLGGGEKGITLCLIIFCFFICLTTMYGETPIWSAVILWCSSGRGGSSSCCVHNGSWLPPGLGSCRQVSFAHGSIIYNMKTTKIYGYITYIYDMKTKKIKYIYKTQLHTYTQWQWHRQHTHTHTCVRICIHAHRYAHTCVKLNVTFTNLLLWRLWMVKIWVSPSLYLSGWQRNKHTITKYIYNTSMDETNECGRVSFLYLKIKSHRTLCMK